MELLKSELLTRQLFYFETLKLRGPKIHMVDMYLFSFTQSPVEPIELKLLIRV
jgi:hypothetical protein